MALEISSHESFLRAFARSMAGNAIVSTLLMDALGWIAMHRALLPLRTMAAEALDMTANRLDHRLSTSSGPLELMELGRTLNDMLRRLEAAFKRLSDFSSDLAHELRPPLSNIMTQTQISVSRVRTIKEYRETFYENIEKKWRDCL